jgi:hypothetical protein
MFERIAQFVATIASAMRESVAVAQNIDLVTDTSFHGAVGVVRYPSHTPGHAYHTVRVVISRRDGYNGRVPAGTAYATCDCAAYVDGHRPCYAMLNVAAAVPGVVPLGSYLWTGTRRPVARGA